MDQLFAFFWAILFSPMGLVQFQSVDFKWLEEIIDGL
jgi:hypothetical protein